MADPKPAVERLSEDESLRGDLSDIGFGPLLDWAVAAVTAYAPKADDNALDVYTGRVRGVVQSAVQAAGDGKLDDPAALLDFDPADRAKVSTELQNIKFGDDPDDNAVQLATVLQTGLTAVPAPAPDAPVENPPAQEAPQPAPTTPAVSIEAAAQALEAAATQAVSVAGTTSKPEPAQPQTEAAPPPTEQGQAAVQPPQETAPPQPESVQTQPEAAAPEEEATQPPQKKNEQDAESAAPLPPEQSQSPNLNQNANPGQNPEPAAQTAPAGVFFDGVKSRVGQAYTSAWGIFKGITKRRTG